MSQTSTIPPRAQPPVEGHAGVFTLGWFGWFNRINILLGKGFTGTIATAKLTSGGSNGSITFQNGVVVAQTAAS